MHGGWGEGVVVVIKRAALHSTEHVVVPAMCTLARQLLTIIKGCYDGLSAGDNYILLPNYRGGLVTGKVKLLPVGSVNS